MSADIERWWSQSRRQQCDGKVRHRSQQEAEVAARLLELQTHAEYSVYRCPFCRRWHVGSSR